MRDYAQIRPRFWIQGTGRELRGDHEAREVALYLMSAPTSNLIGLYYLPLTTLAHELGMTLDEAGAALDRVCAKGFAKYDHATEYVWVVNMAREQVGEEVNRKDKRILGVRNELKKHSKSVFHAQFCALYAETFELEKAPSIPLPSPSGGASNQNGRSGSPLGAPPISGTGTGTGTGTGRGSQSLSSSHGQEAREGWAKAWSDARRGTVPQLAGQTFTAAVEFARRVAQDHDKPLYEAAYAIASGVLAHGKPGQEVFDLARIDPYARSGPAKLSPDECAARFREQVKGVRV